MISSKSKKPVKVSRTWDDKVSKEDAAKLDFTESEVSEPAYDDDDDER